MKRSAWNKFSIARENYRKAVLELERSLPKLKKMQQKLVNSRISGSQDKGSAKTGSLVYRVETPIVYNCALDDVTSHDDIRLILVADNPGRREQAAENRRYLVGPSGKIAEKFFRDNPSLGINFRQNVIILNKTPIHTPRTVELRDLCHLGGPSLVKTLTESQTLMADLLLDFQLSLCDAQVWITGYSEMKKGGIFETYTETLRCLYAKKNTARLINKVFIFRHFSMNQFTIDLKQQLMPKKSLTENLETIGTSYRQRILGV